MLRAAERIKKPARYKKKHSVALKKRSQPRRQMWDGIVPQQIVYFCDVGAENHRGGLCGVAHSRGSATIILILIY